MTNKFAFEHNGEWHYSTAPETDAKTREEKWEFLRTHKVKYFYETNEELLQAIKNIQEIDECINSIEKLCVDRSIKIKQPRST